MKDPGDLEYARRMLVQQAHQFVISSGARAKSIFDQGIGVPTSDNAVYFAQLQAQILQIRERDKKAIAKALQ